MAFTTVSLIIWGIELIVASRIDVNHAMTYGELYNAGVDAYLDSKWDECSSLMNKALADHKHWKNLLADCRLKCQQQSGTGLDRDEFLELAFFDTAMKRSKCNNQCTGSRKHMFNIDIEEAFDSLQPYHYLQICAYQDGNIELACSAAFTYLTAHPGDELMNKNMEFYRGLEEAKPSYFKDLEALPHQVKYDAAVEAYGQGEWDTVVKTMEDALTLYYLEDLQCAARCEVRYDHEPGSDFYTDVTFQWIEMMKCKKNCPSLMNTLFGKVVQNYLAEHYNYLQYSYYKLGKKDKAMACIATYLLFRPDHEPMIKNKEYYMEEGIARDKFTVRKDASQYHKRHLLEDMLFNSMQGLYLQQSNLKESALEAEQNPLERNTRYMYEPNINYENDLATFTKLGVKLVPEQHDLATDHRMAADGLLSDNDSTTLVKLADMAMKLMEVGSKPDVQIDSIITPVHVAEMAVQGFIPMSSVILWLNVLETSRKFLQSNLRLVDPLYFHHIYITCIEAPTEACLLQPDGSCAIEKPTEPEFGSLIYLNDDFEGGDFIFTNKDRALKSVVSAKYGRMVGFSSKDHHEIKNITRGKLYILATWYTMDSREQDLGYAQARTILRIDKNKKRKVKNPGLQSLMKKSDIAIIMTEDELNGPQRFAADGLASSTECDLLIGLANSGGLRGDGYKSSDPLTRHEKYAGLTVARAAELATSHVADKKTVQLYLDLSEKARHLVETYFKPEKPMYFDYTQLVCRTARDEKNTARKDLSHPIHADNCIIQPDNSCKKEAPAYTQRDFSALLYLNHDFAGGEIFFSHENMTVQSSVKPKCGRIVAFNATNYHGVKAVLKGQRCAVAMWYTLDAQYREEAHTIASNMIANLGPGSKFDGHHREL